MIIECQACRARFRLDESRIKGKGARVRCRKCGESIIVMKSDFAEPSPPPPSRKEGFDLRAVLRGPEAAPPPPPRDEADESLRKLLHTGTVPGGPVAPPEPAQPTDTVDALDRIFRQEREAVPSPTAEPPPEEYAPEPAQTPVDHGPPRDEVDDALVPAARSAPESGHAPAETEEKSFEPAPAEPPSGLPPPGAEIDAAFDRILHAAPESGHEPPETEEEAFEPAPAEPPPGEEVGAAFDRILHAAPESGHEPPETEEEAIDAGTAGPPPDLPPPGKDIDAFSLDLEKEDLPFLRGRADGPAPPPPEIKPGEEVLIVPAPPAAEETAPTEEGEEFLVIDNGSSEYLRKEQRDPDPAGRFDISERLSQTLPRGEEGERETGAVSASRADAIQDELAALADHTPAGSRAAEPPEEIHPPIPPPAERKPSAARRAETPSRRPSITLLVLLFVALAGGGAFLGFTKTGQETLSLILPGMESFWLGGREPARAYNIENLIGYHETSDSAGRLFVIKGVVINQGKKATSGIRIRAELLDADRKTIAEKSAYAGNVIPGLRSADRETIEAALSNRFGDKLSNVDVAAGKSVPFIVVFVDPPEGIEEYRLEVLTGE